jgi:hypothetical protein
MLEDASGELELNVDIALFTLEVDDTAIELGVELGAAKLLTSGAELLTATELRLATELLTACELCTTAELCTTTELFITDELCTTARLEADITLVATDRELANDAAGELTMLAADRLEPTCVGKELAPGSSPVPTELEETLTSEDKLELNEATLEDKLLLRLSGIGADALPPEPPQAVRRPQNTPRVIAFTLIILTRLDKNTERDRQHHPHHASMQEVSTKKSMTDRKPF